MLSKSHRRLRAQSSIEFILIFGLLLLILSIGTTVAWVRIFGVSQAQKNLEISKILDEASNKINLAFLEGNGFSINLTMPKKIHSQDYTIDIYSNNVVIYFANATYSKHLLTENITGIPKKGTSIIANINGEVVIS